MTKLQQALRELNERLHLGAEFPEAGYLVAWRFKLDQHDLADAYDAQFHRPVA